MKIELKEITVRDLTNGYEDNQENGVIGYGGKLDIRPPYQREFIYKDKQREAVIDTITKDYPLNVMCSGKSQAFEELCEIFNTETKQGEDMQTYSELLAKAIDEISRIFNKRSNQIITGNDRGALLIPKSKRISETNNFELVTWLIIK